jgi:predicted transcriptional regulator
MIIKNTIKCYVVTFCLLTTFFGCKKKQIEIIIENSSNVTDSLSINVMLENKLIFKNIHVKRDRNKITFEVLRIDFPKGKTTASLNFTLNNTGEMTQSLVSRDSIKQKATVHVNFLEVRFLKGFALGTKVLQKDSIVRREFYSEVIYK